MNRRRNERRSWNDWTSNGSAVKEEWPRPVYLRPGISVLVQIFEETRSNPMKRGRCVPILPRASYELFTVWSQMWPGIRLFSYVEWKRSWKMANKSSFKVGIVATIFLQNFTTFGQVYKLLQDFLLSLFFFPGKFKLKLDFCQWKSSNFIEVITSIAIHDAATYISVNRERI